MCTRVEVWRVLSVHGLYMYEGDDEQPTVKRE